MRHVNSSIIEKLNSFLSKEIFDIPNFLGVEGIDKPIIKGKVQLTGEKDYLSIGEWKNFIQYTLFLIPQEEQGYGIINLMMNNKKEIVIDTSTSKFYRQIQVVNQKLKTLFEMYSIDSNPICTKIVNSGKNSMNESLISEGKYDGITRSIVRDITQLYKHQREGEFDLPESITGDEEYSFENFGKNFSVTLDLIMDDGVETFDIDAEYYDDEEIIYITIKTNPTFRYSPEIIQQVIQELNEIVRHELEHVKQFKLGVPRGKQYRDHEKYYSQPQELDAQRAGFKRRSKQEKKPMEYLVRKWFEDNKNKYKMNADQIERVINKILDKS